MNKKLSIRNLSYLLILILTMAIFPGCSNESIKGNSQISSTPQADNFRNITPEEAKKRMDSEEGIILLDVRTKEEYENGHINDAILIPVDVLEIEAEKNFSDKEAPIFVYCRSGNRSATAARILINLGYKNVYNLNGINAWPYEIIK